MNEPLTLDDARWINGEITERMYRYSKDGLMSKYDAWHLGNVELANELGIEDPGGKAGQVFRKHQIELAKSNPPPNKPKDGNKTDSESSWTALYAAWCADNDFIPKDNTLAHFCGCSSAALQYGRSKLISEGWIFESTKYGWKVVQRPQPPQRTYTVEEVNDIVTTAVADALRRAGIGT